MKGYLTPLLVIVFSMFACCQSDEINTFEREVTTPSDDICLDPDFPVCIRYETLNEIGQVMSKFDEGENIVFSFEIENRSNQAIYLRNTDDVFLTNPYFMRVLDSDGNEVVSLLSGVSYTHQANFIIPSYETYRYQVSYDDESKVVGHSFSSDGGFPVVAPFTDQNILPLEPGEYFSSFDSDYVFTLEGEEQRYRFTIPLSLRFSVQ